MRTFEERLEAQADQHKESVEFFKQWFRDHDTEVRTNMTITFTGQSNHDIQLQKNSAYRRAGFEVETSRPEYDGMVRHYIILTDKVEL